jgi:hypothetical protein
VTFLDFEQRTGDPGHALEPIRAQHRGLVAELSAIDAALSAADFSAFCTHLDVLDRLLREHQATEERLLPPATAAAA